PRVSRGVPRLCVRGAGGGVAPWVVNVEKGRGGSLPAQKGRGPQNQKKETAMKKSFTGGDRGQGVGASGAEGLIQVQLPLGMLATLEDVQRGFFSLCVAAGREVLTAMMEREREALCGPKWIPNAQRRAVRGGTMKSQVTLG